MNRIISIGTALPAFRHQQARILQFMQLVFALDATEQRKLKYLYSHSGIEARYSIINDYSEEVENWQFYPATESLEPFPSIESRMHWYNRHAHILSLNAIDDCLKQTPVNATEITHLITVSCTGLSAPGLDLQIMESLGLAASVYRTSVNFMGCYGALHALKQADFICKVDASAKVMIVCVELCTLHFQKIPTPDNMASSLLFGDGAAAMLISANTIPGIIIRDFFAEVKPEGKKDMTWELSSTGFQMTLSSYVPDLIETDFESLVIKALQKYGLNRSDIDGWCIHPGGKRILHAVEKCIQLYPGALFDSHEVLRQYGNMSSPSILFVLRQMVSRGLRGNIIGAAFGPGLTMETCWLEVGVS